MRNIISYNKFQINESVGFQNSKEYSDILIKYSKISNEELKEYFYDILDENIASVRIYKFIGDEKGQILSANIDGNIFSEEYFIIYAIDIESKDYSCDLLNLRNNIENIKKVSNNLQSIYNTVTSFESRITRDVIKSISGTGNEIKIRLRVKGEKIESFRKFYNTWMKSRGPNYEKGIKELVNQYENAGIPEPDLDTNEYPDRDIIDIGFMEIEDEIISVASYSKSKDEFTIDWPEFRRSVHNYREENQN